MHYLIQLSVDFFVKSQNEQEIAQHGYIRFADVDAVARLESFRALKLSGFESFRALKLSNLANIMMTLLKCISGCSDCFS